MADVRTEGENRHRPEKSPLDDLSARTMKAQATIERWTRELQARRPGATARAMPPEVASAKAELKAIEKLARAALAGTASGKVELSRRDMMIAQRLFFTGTRERRTSTARAFRFWWRFVDSKGGVLSLVQSLGIYCVYTQDLVAALARLITGRPCLEVGAGDGTLALRLEEAGVPTTAVDDQSWSHRIRYPGWVEKSDAVAALAKHQPRTVVCSWPPPGNTFERQIFRTPGVDLYVVIGSRHRFASGNWLAYEEQKNFTWGIDEGLSSLVMPPELDSAVLVFKRL